MATEFPDPVVSEIGKIVYKSGDPYFVINPTSSVEGSHRKYEDENLLRIRTEWTENKSNHGPCATLKGKPDKNGNAYYLPYKDDTITSMRVPAVPPPEVTLFLTGNMSGCKLFIDEIDDGSGDLVIFHANTKKYKSPDTDPPNSQTTDALNVLNDMHQKAVLHYAEVNPAHKLQPRANCAKKVYFEQPAIAERAQDAKLAQAAEQAASPELAQDKKKGKVRNIIRGAIGAIAGRSQGKKGKEGEEEDDQNSEFIGGCSIMGFLIKGVWQFHYQTYGYVTGPDFPASVKDKDNYTKVMDHKQIYPDSQVESMVGSGRSSS